MFSSVKISMQINVEFGERKFEPLPEVKKIITMPLTLSMYKSINDRNIIEDGRYLL